MTPNTEENPDSGGLSSQSQFFNPELLGDWNTDTQRQQYGTNMPYFVLELCTDNFFGAQTSNDLLSVPDAHSLSSSHKNTHPHTYHTHTHTPHTHTFSFARTDTQTNRHTDK